MLRNIALKNFKCWQALDIELAPITLFFGTNSSGKTAILQSLLMLKQTARGFDSDQHINFGGRDQDFVDFGSYLDLVYAHDAQKDISLSLDWELSSILHVPEATRTNDNEIAYNMRRFDVESLKYDISWYLNNEIFIHSLKYVASVDGSQPYFIQVRHVDGDSYTLEYPKLAESETVSDSQMSFAFSKVPEDAFKQMSLALEEVPEQSIIVGSPERCHILPDDLVAKSPLLFTFVSRFFSQEFESLMNRVLYLGPLRQYPRRYYLWSGGKPQVIEPDGASTIETLISSRRNEMTLHSGVERWLTSLNLADSLFVRPTDEREKFYEVSVEVSGKTSALIDVGFGVSQVLPVITMLLSAPEGSIVLLEQPELHLHPNAQSALADLLLYAAEQRGLQLIVESHSEHILRRLQRRVAEAQPAFAKPANIKMYFCKTGEAGSSIDEVEIDRFGQISNWPENFLGDISGDLHSMVKAALARRKMELAVE